MTVKLGSSSNIINRQKTHYSSSPFLTLFPYQVNDAYRAEQKLHQLAQPYKLKPGDIINGITIDSNVQADEHYKLSETEAQRLCEQIHRDYHPSKPLEEQRTICVDCQHVINISTLQKNDGFRCARCYEKMLKETFKNNVIANNTSDLKYTKEDLEEEYRHKKYGDNYDLTDGFIIDDGLSEYENDDDYSE